MAFIEYADGDAIPETDRVADDDNIIRVHGVHSRTIPLHYELYRELMYAKGPLTRVQRELIAVRVSALNDCHY
ncbi:MAG: carboxymuconolactone decarboxylase family protein [Gemmatimonadetes bacterium]|nr:carboxymuconolactone decarboxylase family protein [Gemmatimonadota bacterium]